MEITLNGKPVTLSSRRGKQFAADCAKVASHEITIDQLRRRYELTADALQTIIDDPAFVRTMAQQNKHKPDAATSNNVVELRPQPRFEDNLELVQDLARYAEGSRTERQIRRAYKFDDATWEKMGNDEALVEAIEAERIRRLHDGSAKRDLAQLHIVKAPAILDSIMSDTKANNKHRVDAIRTLDSIASPPAQAGSGDSSRFIISISMGSETVTFNKSRSVNVDDVDDPDNTTLAIISASKQETDDGSQGHI